MQIIDIIETLYDQTFSFIWLIFTIERKFFFIDTFKSGFLNPESISDFRLHIV